LEFSQNMTALAFWFRRHDLITWSNVIGNDRVRKGSFRIVGTINEITRGPCLSACV
jgi:hypothetical protein